MRSLTLVVMVAGIIAVLALPAMAQNGRLSAMGGIGVGLADDDSAFIGNPAGLPLLNTFGETEALWPSRVSGLATVDADWDRYGAWYSTCNAEQSMGWGAGYWRWDGGSSETDSLGAGFGMALNEDGLTAGISVLHDDTTTHMSPTQNGADLENTFINLGLMYAREDEMMNLWRFGLLVRDITEENAAAPLFDIGASVHTPTGLILGIDVLDVTEEVESTVNIGAEYPIPMSDFIVRAGLMDGDFTAGVGYRQNNWEVGVSYQDLDAGEETALSLIGCF